MWDIVELVAEGLSLLLESLPGDRRKRRKRRRSRRNRR